MRLLLDKPFWFSGLAAAVPGCSGPRSGYLWIDLGCCHQFTHCLLVLPRPRGAQSGFHPDARRGRHTSSTLTSRRSDLALRRFAARSGAVPPSVALVLCPSFRRLHQKRAGLLGHGRRRIPPTLRPGI